MNSNLTKVITIFHKPIRTQVFQQVKISIEILKVLEVVMFR